MIYDCFTFFNELDLLEIRLNTLAPVVDKFVIAEATRTHSGKPKELFFEKNRGRFAAFADKIIYIVVDDLLTEDEVARDSFNLPWVNENRQRNALARGLTEAKDDDVVLVSDVDEIPRPESMGKITCLLSSGARCVRCEMAFFNFYLNFRNYSYAKWLLGTMAIRFAELKDDSLFTSIKPDRYTQASENKGNTLHKVRFLSADRALENAGWHFSYLGGVDAIQRKLAAFAHSEFASVPREILERRLQNGDDLFGRAGKSFAEPIDESFPAYVAAHKDALSKYVFPVTDEYMQRTALARRMATLRGRIYALLVRMVPPCLSPAAVRLRDAVMKVLRRN